MKLFVVKDGIKNLAIVRDSHGNRILNTNYFSLSYNFKSNVGYLEKIGKGNWKLYTQIGITHSGKGGCFYSTSLEGCIQKLAELKGDNEILVINSKEIDKHCE
jgi:hypothetical protein